MTTEYIIDTSMRIGSLSRYDPAYHHVRRIKMLVDAMSRRKTLEIRAAELDRESYRETVTEAGK